MQRRLRGLVKQLDNDFSVGEYRRVVHSFGQNTGTLGSDTRSILLASKALLHCPYADQRRYLKVILECANTQGSHNLDVMAHLIQTAGAVQHYNTVLAIVSQHRDAIDILPSHGVTHVVNAFCAAGMPFYAGGALWSLIRLRQSPTEAALMAVVRAYIQEKKIEAVHEIMDTLTSLPFIHVPMSCHIAVLETQSNLTANDVLEAVLRLVPEGKVVPIALGKYLYRSCDLDWMDVNQFLLDEGRFFPPILMHEKLQQSLRQADKESINTLKRQALQYPHVYANLLHVLFLHHSRHSGIGRALALAQDVPSDTFYNSKEVQEYLERALSKLRDVTSIHAVHRLLCPTYASTALVMKRIQELQAWTGILDAAEEARGRGIRLVDDGCDGQVFLCICEALGRLDLVEIMLAFFWDHIQSVRTADQPDCLTMLLSIASDVGGIDLDEAFYYFRALGLGHDFRSMMQQVELLCRQFNWKAASDLLVQMESDPAFNSTSKTPKRLKKLTGGAIALETALLQLQRTGKTEECIRMATHAAKKRHAMTLNSWKVFFEACLENNDTDTIFHVVHKVVSAYNDGIVPKFPLMEVCNMALMLLIDRFKFEEAVRHHRFLIEQEIRVEPALYSALAAAYALTVVDLSALRSVFGETGLELDHTCFSKLTEYAAVSTTHNAQFESIKTQLKTNPHILHSIASWRVRHSLFSGPSC